MSFSLTATVTGIKEQQALLVKFTKALDKPVLAAFKRGTKKLASQIRGDIRGEGIGRSIWGAKPQGLARLVRDMPVTKTGDELATGVKLTGIPVLIEDGGRIKRHQIKPRGRPLASKARGFFSRGPVQHPGMSIPGRHFARTAADREGPNILAECNRGIAELRKELFG